ncbi:2OG-Fe(II) oxygenase family protein [Plantactinospora mayteni]|uniref:2OG-Fe(II) oxygenase n=1 Tax=Plantactinospora mayteni TaxID=566021 RepID=A0ABQ4EIB4_9ACTN|nr:isopenicillin N synthase family oxygenase [Plantactinospora mayteni]GIG94479.1 2OG-Fe(II) oxygenase [Plantactinospora mayteni]
MTLTEVDYRAPGAGPEFDRSLRRTGFAVLRNPPIDPTLVPTIYHEWLAFLDSDAKLAYAMDSGRVDGYLAPPPPGPINRDRKELFHIYRDGRYPAEVSPAGMRYFRQAHELARTLLGWLDLHGDPQVTRRFPMPTAGMIDGSEATVLRVQRYLPQPAGTPGGVPRALAHTDINLVTLLPTPSRPGLQILVDDEWTDVCAEPGSLVVQVGEMLEAVSGGAYPAALHQVMPEPSGAGDSRISMPLFVHPADHVRILPDRTAGQFRHDRLAELRAQNWVAVAGGSAATAA